MLSFALLCRSRSWAVLSLLTLSLLLVPPNARAGTYAFTGYTVTPGSGDTATYTPNNYPTATDSRSAFTSYGGAPEYYSVVANDKITAAFTWQPTNGNSAADPPPSCAIIQQTSSVSWTGAVTGNPPLPTGDCDTGLPASVSTYTTGYLTKGGSGTYYSLKSQPGASFTVDCTPTASSSGSSGSPGSGSHSSVSIFYSASASPVTITPGGTTPDSSGALNILVGQGCTASLNTPPFSVSQQSGWTWTVSGTKFQSWNVSSDQQTATLIPVPNPLTDPTPQWFWNDLGPSPTPETVVCTATVTPSAGQGSPFTVTATQKVTVQEPDWQSGLQAGYMQVNTLDSSFPSNYALWAGPPVVNPLGANGGMGWQAKVETPQTPVPFGRGSLEIVQLDTPNDSYTTYTNPVQTHTDPLNTAIHYKGLDVTCPYQNYVFAESTDPNARYSNGDAPGLQLTGFKVLVAGTPTTVVAASASFNGDYYDYLMYQPPSSGTSVSWVPLGTLHWSVTSSATLPDSKLWSDYKTVHGSDSAGTVTPDQDHFVPGNAFPLWTILNKPQAY